MNNWIDVKRAGRLLSSFGVAACCLAGAMAMTFSTGAVAQSEQGEISVELNKLEPIDTGCRVYVVVNNRT